MTPPIVISEVEGFRIVRDDLIPGGTKRRILDASIAELPAAELVYASPAYGYAQIALAHAAAAVGKRSAIFVAKRAQPHARTLQAKAAGARVFQVEHGYLSNVQAKAKAYADRHGAMLLPFGMGSPPVPGVALPRPSASGFSGPDPEEVWSVAGSGTLSRALQVVWPAAKFFAVQVGRDPSVGRAKLLVEPETFEQDAKYPPHFPVAATTDAKAWRFIKAYGKLLARSFWDVGALDFRIPACAIVRVSRFAIPKTWRKRCCKRSCPSPRRAR